MLVISTFVLAYCQDIAAFFVDLVGGGKGSWDPEWKKDVSQLELNDLRRLIYSR